mmetsp:Transcript_6296/g.9316  ORF Transcript_6296/g.9316 Transcript_6296/m.9316 type:complete len:97 (-) Transcript_6296:50-340(-)
MLMMGQEQQRHCEISQYMRLLSGFIVTVFQVLCQSLAHLKNCKHICDCVEERNSAIFQQKKKVYIWSWEHSCFLLSKQYKEYNIDIAFVNKTLNFS